MIQWPRRDILADRWVACRRTFTFVGLDFTDAVFAAHIRTLPDAGGSPLVNLATVVSSSAEGLRLIYGGTDTIASHIAAGRLSEVPPGTNQATDAAWQESDIVALSQIGMRVNETTMEGLPFPDDTGDDMPLAWDLHVTPSGGVKDKYMGGSFSVVAGATQ